MRSSWKFVYIHSGLFRKIFLKKIKFSRRFENDYIITLWNKRSFIPKFCLESIVKIYNGKYFVRLPIQRHIIGSFFGQFVLTKRITRIIHEKNSKNKLSGTVKILLKTDSRETIRKLNLFELLSEEEKKAYMDFDYK